MPYVFNKSCKNSLMLWKMSKYWKLKQTWPNIDQNFVCTASLKNFLLLFCALPKSIQVSSKITHLAQINSFIKNCHLPQLKQKKKTKKKNPKKQQLELNNTRKLDRYFSCNFWLMLPEFKSWKRFWALSSRSWYY